MQKMMQWMIAATLIISGMSVLTACGSDDDNENNPPVQPDDDGGNSGTTSSITYIERSWDGEKVVDQEVKKTAGWMDAENFSNGVWKLQGIWYVTGYLNLDGADFRVNGDLHIVLCDDAVLVSSLSVILNHIPAPLVLTGIVVEPSKFMAATSRHRAEYSARL